MQIHLAGSPTDWAGPWGLQVEAACSEPRFQVSRPSPSAQSFLFIPQPLKGLLSPQGTDKQQQQLCVSSQARTAWKQKLLSPRDRSAPVAVASQLGRESEFPRVWSGVHHTHNTLIHTNPETASGQTGLEVRGATAPRGLGKDMQRDPSPLTGGQGALGLATGHTALLRPLSPDP